MSGGVYAVPTQACSAQGQTHWGIPAKFNFTSGPVAAAWAVATQKAKFHIERENPLISWPWLPYECKAKLNWQPERDTAENESRLKFSFSVFFLDLYFLHF